MSRTDSLDDLRRALLQPARAMQAQGLNRGKAGNDSVRCADGDGVDFLVTPTGVDNETANPGDMVANAAPGDGRGREHSRHRATDHRNR